MKLLFISPSLAGGGAERVLVGLVNALAARGITIVLALLRREGPYLERLGAEITVVDCCYRNVPWAVAAAVAMPTCIRLAKGCDAIIGAQELLPCYLARIASLVTGKPDVAWIHTSLRAYAPRIHPIHRVLSRMTLRHAHSAVFVSKAALASYEGWVGAAATRARVIYNPFDPSAYPSSRSSCGLVSGEPHILAMGRLAYEKGFDNLLRAYALLRERGVRVPLVIAGEGALRGELVSLAQELGIADRVSFPGFVVDSLAAMRGAALFVLSSRYEGLPTVLIEALYVGVPIVATECGSAGEILDGSACGLVVPPEDPRALADGIEELLRDGDRQARFGRQSAGCLRKFAPEAIVDTWAALVQSAQRVSVDER